MNAATILLYSAQVIWADIRLYLCRALYMEDSAFITLAAYNTFRLFSPSFYPCHSCFLAMRSCLCAYESQAMYVEAKYGW